MVKNLFTSHQKGIEIWTYPEGHEIQNLFNQRFDILEISPYSRIAPNPEAMIETINQQENAIGFIPSSYLFEDVQVIPINDIEKDQLRFPVLVLSNDEPGGEIKLFIHCLQQQLSLEN